PRDPRMVRGDAGERDRPRAQRRPRLAPQLHTPRRPLAERALLGAGHRDPRVEDGRGWDGRGPPHRSRDRGRDRPRPDREPDLQGGGAIKVTSDQEMIETRTLNRLRAWVEHESPSGDEARATRL